MTLLANSVEQQRQQYIHKLFTAGARSDNYYTMSLSELELEWQRFKECSS
jgi:hypothetical protein